MTCESIRRARMIAAVIACLVTTGRGLAAAAETITFWSSGYSQEMQDWLRKEAFPSFEAAHSIRIDHSEIGWGAAREEKLVVAHAAGVGPDVYVNPGYEFGLPLDQFIARWPDRTQIDPALWEAVRDRRSGVIYRVPQLADFRGIAYHQRLFAEAGLEPQPPQSWDDMLQAARKLTRTQEGEVLQSGFETVWGAPYVGSEYDWFLQQTGTQLVSADLRTSQIDSEEGLEALRFMVELFRTSHPPGMAALSEADFAQGKVGMARGGPWVLRGIEENIPDDVGYIDVFAPQRSPAGPPIAMAFVNGLGISKQSTQPALAWAFIDFMLSDPIQAGLAPLTNQLVIRRSVATNMELAPIRAYAPWYRIMSFASIPGLFPGRSQAAPFLVDALHGRRSPEEAIRLMDDAAQVALDRYWSEAP
ncbi:MAG TPA: sugar ABC transporter substrate-binding protein [Limnochordia bacterium]